MLIGRLRVGGGGEDGHDDDGEGVDVGENVVEWAYGAAVCAECGISSIGVPA